MGDASSQNGSDANAQPRIASAKPSHTPGPWIAKKGAGWFVTRPHAVERREAAIAVGMTPATSLVGSPTSDKGDECEANARLMAAAPDLLECLNNWIELADSAIEEMGIGPHPTEAAVLESARAAVRRATGASPQ